MKKPKPNPKLDKVEAKFPDKKSKPAKGKGKKC